MTVALDSASRRSKLGVVRNWTLRMFQVWSRVHLFKQEKANCLYSQLGNSQVIIRNSYQNITAKFGALLRIDDVKTIVRFIKQYIMSLRQ